MISFVGAGPGAADLLTVRAVDRLASADIVIWAGSLVAPEVLSHCRDDAVLHDSKHMTLEEICGVFAAHPEARIVRLHSGDPTIFSAVAEQIAWCVEHGRAFEIVPGVSSFTAAAAAAGCELTLPGVAQSVVLTRLASGTAAGMPPRETLRTFAATGATLAVFLSVSLVEELTAELLAEGSGFEPQTPVVVAHRVGQPAERVLHTTIADLAHTVRAEGLRTTTLFLIGPALAGATGAACGIRSHVYAPDYATRFRPARQSSSSRSGR
jgi:precorrin-4/cobalt-precorrin-4 C11-methyltransferase